MPYIPVEGAFAFQKWAPCQLDQSMKPYIGIWPHLSPFLHIGTALHCCHATISQSSWSADPKPDKQTKHLTWPGLTATAASHKQATPNFASTRSGSRFSTTYGRTLFQLTHWRSASWTTDSGTDATINCSMKPLLLLCRHWRFAGEAWRSAEADPWWRGRKGKAATGPSSADKAFSPH